MKTMLAEIVAALAPIVMLGVGAFLTLTLNRVTTIASSRWGIEIEARHREALHSALMSGVQAALRRGLTGSDATRAGLEYALRSTPDAVSALKPAEGVLRSIAESKLREALAGNVPAMASARRD